MPRKDAVEHVRILELLEECWKLVTGYGERVGAHRTRRTSATGWGLRGLASVDRREAGGELLGTLAVV